MSCKYVSLADKKTDYTEFAGVGLFFFIFHLLIFFSKGGRMLRSRGLGVRNAALGGKGEFQISFDLGGPKEWGAEKDLS